MDSDAKTAVRYPKGVLRKLSTGASLTGRQYLFDAGDHLLLVNGSYVEEYRRIHYRDIEAIALRRTQHSLWLTLVLALTTLLLLLLFLISFAEPGIDSVWTGVFATVLGTLLTLHAMRGQSVRFLIKTAVKAETLCSVRFERRARKVISTIRDRIAQHQETPASSTP